MNIKELAQISDKLFSDRLTLMSTWQELAENFYPERADFTITRQIGTEYASNLMTSYPIIVRRDLGNQFGAMLRPAEKEWFKQRPEDLDRLNNESERWLERSTKIQRRAMYGRRTQFTRATKEGDQDFSAFGQCVISVRLNRNFDSLLYQNHHLRDVVWTENEEGQTGFIARRMKPQARNLTTRMKGKVDKKVSDLAKKDPFAKCDCIHIICEADMYDDNAKGRPYWSLYYDQENETLMEAVPVWNKEYVIPRWQTVSGSQYAYSPASITALPEARLIQAMSYSLLEAGEKAVNPPMIATVDTVRSDMALYAGGVTWASKEYDQREGAVLQPLTQDFRGLPFGFEMQTDTRALIHQAFYLNKLNLPERAPEMTAYEVGQRIQEYIRGAIPIFEPMEINYNGELCDLTFDILIRAGAFGSIEDIPSSLSGADINFQFESPLHDAIDQIKGQKFLEANALLAEAVAIDQSAINLIDVKTALRDAFLGVGISSEWIRSKDDVKAITRRQQEEVQEKEKLEQMQQGAQVVSELAKAQVAA